MFDMLDPGFDEDKVGWSHLSRKNSTDKLKTRNRQINKLLNNPLFFSKNPQARVKFVMGIVNLILGCASKPPSEKDELRINTHKMPSDFARYLWTALMVFGKNLASMSFDHKSIWVMDDSGFDSEEVQNELGGIRSTFSERSLYETIFKHYLTKDMLLLQENPELFEDVSTQGYQTVEAQIEAKERRIPKEVKRDVIDEQISKLLNDVTLFPDEPSGRVKYAMALANFILLNTGSPTEARPFEFSGAREGDFLTYLWTALIVFGQNLPHVSFNHKALQFPTSLKEELGWWSYFQETRSMKRYLNRISGQKCFFLLIILNFLKGYLLKNLTVWRNKYRKNSK